MPGLQMQDRTADAQARERELAAERKQAYKAARSLNQEQDSLDNAVVAVHHQLKVSFPSPARLPVTPALCQINAAAYEGSSSLSWGCPRHWSRAGIHLGILRNSSTSPGSD